MKIAVYTLTRERLEYTKLTFAKLKEKAGYEYDHYVIDNGSKDGTVEWLKENESQFKKVIYFEENQGISGGSNAALEAIFSSGENYDLIIKMDNDCMVVTGNILQHIVNVYTDIFSKELGPKYVLSPRVEGIVNQPKRVRTAGAGDLALGITSIVGGLFHIVPAEVYKMYRYPVELPKAWGQDDHFCDWFRKSGGECAYIEPLVVEHYETTNGQAARFPEYFERKHLEEKQ